jgi:mRNA interferase RelE/StbE
MSYSVVLSKSAEKSLKKIPKADYLRIREHINKLEDDPFPPGYKKLEDSDDYYRIRVGIYRIIYSVLTEVLIIKILAIGHRKDIYRNL